ncbi:hypothetical protein [Lacinutrix undariae]
MKTAALILSLFLFIKPIIPLFEYAAFYDYIKNELCENKDLPELKCNGKCHLKKELAKASNSEKSNDKNQSKTVELSFVYFQNTTIDYQLFFQKKQAVKINRLNNTIYKFHYSNFIFHPPIV